MPTRPTPDPQNAEIIINPVSGKPGDANRIDQMTDWAAALGWRGQISQTTEKRGADAIIAESLARKATHFVVCGGDGTIAQAVAALTGQSATLGVVPGGTGNLFAQNMNIPSNRQQALQIALTGQARSIDVGLANGTHFTIMAGMGLDAQMVRDADQESKNKIGVLAYVGTVIKNLPRRAARFAISIDGAPAKTYVAKMVMVANLGRISGGLEVVPDAHPDDGTLKVGIIKATSSLDWLNLAFHGLLRQIEKSNQYTLLEGTDIDIKCLGRPQPFECDGNHFPPTQQLHINILPKGLWVMQP